MSPEFESRRQRRQAEILAQSAPALPSSVVQASVPESRVAIPLAASSAPQPPASMPLAPTALPQSAQASVPALSRRELRLKQSADFEPRAGSGLSSFVPAQPSAFDARASEPESVVTSEMVDDFQMRISRLAESIALAEGTVLPATSGVTAKVAQPPSAVPMSKLYTSDAVEPAHTAQNFRASEIEPPAPSPSSRREMREKLRAVSEQQTSPTTPYAQPWSEVAVTPMFETSSGFSLDTTTNSIVLPVLPDALPGTLVLDQGVTIKTGSIELPNLNTATGSITVVTAAQIADDAMNKDSVNSVVTDISPIAASNLLRNNPRMGLAPVVAKNSKGQVFYVTTTSILMLTVGGLLVAAWMFGFIK